MHFERALLIISAAAAFLASERSARAARFDEVTGTVLLDDSQFAYSFEVDDLITALSMTNRRGMDLTPEQVQAQIIQEGIAGKASLQLGGTAFLARLDFNALELADKFTGRRVELKLWQLPRGLAIGPHVVWSSDAQNALADLPMQLTGRATDDGWQEWTSGPIDFSLGGAVAPFELLLYPSSFGGFGGGMMMMAAPPVAIIDALSIDDLGPAAVPTAQCTLASEAMTCGAQGICSFGRCTDAAAVLGPIFVNPEFRADYLARRKYEFSHLEGGRVPESKLGDFSAALDSAAAETSVANYWSEFGRAVQLLEDGHASPSFATQPAEHSTGICVHLGRADLLPGAPTAPLVFQLSSSSTVAARVRPGDALTAIDGLSIADWTALAKLYITFYGDQSAREVVSTPALLYAAAATGSVLEFSRPLCDPAAGQPCPVDQIQKITIDLGALEDGVWTGSPPPWLADPIACDYRFHRAFAAPNGTAYEFAGSKDEDGVRIVQINGVPAQQSQGGDEWFTAIANAFTDPPAKYILDQRTGYGGGIDAVDHLSSFMIAPEEFGRMEFVPRVEQPFEEAILTSLLNCQNRFDPDPLAQLSGCGNFFEIQLGAGNPSGVARTSSVAILIGYDVSGNDYVSKLLTYRRSGGTRFFGGAPTAGAFGVIWQLPAIQNEVFGGSIQVQDTIFRASAMDTNLAFQTSHGIPVDELVLQKQSDAIRDIDTVIEAAKDWLGR